MLSQIRWVKAASLETIYIVRLGRPRPKSTKALVKLNRSRQQAWKLKAATYLARLYMFSQVRSVKAESTKVLNQSGKCSAA